MQPPIIMRPELHSNVRITAAFGISGRSRKMREDSEVTVGGPPQAWMRELEFVIDQVLGTYDFEPAPSAESMTISDRVLLTIAFSSACSSAGTLNLSSVC